MPQQECVLGRAHHLLDPGDGDVNRRQAGHHSPIALVGDETDGARLGDGEVATAYAHVGVDELVPQRLARSGAELLGLARRWRSELPLKQVADVLDTLMNDRREDMAGWFAGQLHDVLTEIGLDDADPGTGERLVQADFLADHRLRLDDAPDPAPPGQFEHRCPRFGRVSGPVNLAAVGDEIALQFLDQRRHVRDGELADCPNRVPEARPVDFSPGSIAPRNEMICGAVERRA